jgi:mono/diheme cytochrome c family protein
MRTGLWTVFFAGAFAAVGLFSTDLAGQAAKPQGTPETSFKQDVLPIFKGRCVECHAPGGKGFEASGLDLTSFAGLMKGTKFGPMVIPGDAQASSLMAMLDWRVDEKIRMPHGGKKLSICDRDAIRHWINEGALDN